MMYTVYGLTRSVKKSMSKVDKTMQAVEDMTTKLKINPQKSILLDRHKNEIEDLRERASDALDNVTTISKIGRLVPHTADHPDVADLVFIEEDVKDQIESLQKTKKTMKKDKLFNYTFASQTDLLQNHPYFRKKDIPEKLYWTLDFQCLHLPNGEETWEILGFDPSDFLEWWYRERENNDGESNVWSDMRKLAQRLFHAKELLEDPILSRSPLRSSLTDAYTRTRDAILYLMCLIRFSSRSKDKIQIIFEFTAPVVYVTCEITTCTHGIVTEASLSADSVLVAKLSKQLKVLIPLITKIQTFLLSLGASLDFTESMDSAVGLPHGIIKFSSAEVANMCEPILKEAKLVKDEEEMEDFVHETTQRMMEVKMKQVEDDETEEQTLEYIAPPTPWPGDQIIVDSLRALGINRIHVIESNFLIGQGSYGRVLKMKAEDGSRWFAIKQPLRCGPRDKNRLEREAEIWSKLDHKNILPLEGFAILKTFSLPALVSPLCEANLAEFLYNKRHGSSDTTTSNLGEKFTFQFLEDIVNGLTYLHEHHYAHGDLRAVNVLVRQETDSSYYAVLADFGVANATDGATIGFQSRTTKGQKTHDAWLSPELMMKDNRNGDGTRVTQKGDIYAFGCVMLEVQYGTMPFADPESSCEELLQNHALPAKKEELSGLRDSHWQLMCQCWEFDPEKRIRIEDLSIGITRLLKALL